MKIIKTAGVSVALASALALGLGACGNSSSYWQGEESQQIIGSAPAFPDHLDGWKLTKTYQGTRRVFSGTWTDEGESARLGEGDIWPTMTGCDNRRFNIRWQTLKSSKTEVQVRLVFHNGLPAKDFSKLDEDKRRYATYDDGEPYPTLQGSEGAMILDGCLWPQFKDVSTNGLQDVNIEVQELSTSIS